jgi:quercetin dioxygenase-like cupin family protein
MALHHVAPGEIIDLSHAPTDAPDDQSSALFRTPELEVIRRVLHRHQSVPSHHVDGPIVFQCLSGRVSISAGGGDINLAAGQLTYLAPAEPYALTGLEDSVLLMTIVRHRLTAG